MPALLQHSDSEDPDITKMGTSSNADRKLSIIEEHSSEEKHEELFDDNDPGKIASKLSKAKKKKRAKANSKLKDRVKSKDMAKSKDKDKSKSKDRAKSKGS